MEVMFTQKTSIQLLVPENLFSLLPAYHSARRACQELQNPLLQKVKENLFLGEKVPIRADEEWGKVLF